MDQVERVEELYIDVHTPNWQCHLFFYNKKKDTKDIRPNDVPMTC